MGRTHFPELEADIRRLPNANLQRRALTIRVDVSKGHIRGIPPAFSHGVPGSPRQRQRHVDGVT
jgi:hypothetical protein